MATFAREMPDLEAPLITERDQLSDGLRRSRPAAIASSPSSVPRTFREWCVTSANAPIERSCPGSLARRSVHRLVRLGAARARVPSRLASLSPDGLAFHMPALIVRSSRTGRWRVDDRPRVAARTLPSRSSRPFLRRFLSSLRPCRSVASRRSLQAGRVPVVPDDASRTPGRHSVAQDRAQRTRSFACSSLGRAGVRSHPRRGDRIHLGVRAARVHASVTVRDVGLGYGGPCPPRLASRPLHSGCSAAAPPPPSAGSLCSRAVNRLNHVGQAKLRKYGIWAAVVRILS